jgi:N-acetylmuramoyl-L-alanine amidase
LGVGAPEGWRSDGHVLRIVLPDGTRAIDLPADLGPADASRPLVVIDAGHGGHDPGASGEGSLREKQLTLALALALRDALLAQGHVRVALTRSDDRFLALEERSGIARRLHADLFLSIHADPASAPMRAGRRSIPCPTKDRTPLPMPWRGAKPGGQRQRRGAGRAFGCGVLDPGRPVAAEMRSRSIRLADLILREGPG